tara:strand:- start:868 stop:1560 length:693 start_codon:yes stop_codon:yes gene_type:complete
MAVSVDTVYQRVLAVSNKEQRGYITPQEYNLLANQAQMRIFEAYFYDKNLRERQENMRDPVTSETDINQLLARKLAPFTKVSSVTNGNTFPTHYQIGKIFYNGYECRKIDRNEIKRMLSSPRHSGSEPVYTDNPTTTGLDIEVYTPTVLAGGGVTCEVITKPTAVSWGYIVVNGKALYNSNTSTDFELHESEEDTLVINILELAGIVMNKPGLVQIAAQKDGIEMQTQKT